MWFYKLTKDMKKSILLITAMIGLPLFFVSCEKNEPIDDPAIETEGLVETVGLPETRLSLTEAEMGNIARSNDFSIDFFREDYDGKDKLLSPLGFQISLAMVGNLVDNYEDVAKFIGFGTNENKGHVNEYFKHLIEALTGEKCNKELRLANALMSDMKLEKFPESFLEVLPESYFADILKIEAKSLQDQPAGLRPEDIWCQNNTAGMINKAKKRSIPQLIDLANKILPLVSTNLSTDDVIGLAPIVTKMNVSNSIGWPYTVAGATIDGVWYGVPTTLESNVVKLHKEVFGEEDYVLPDRIKEISQQVINKSGKTEGSGAETNNNK